MRHFCRIEYQRHVFIYFPKPLRKKYSSRPHLIFPPDAPIDYVFSLVPCAYRGVSLCAQPPSRCRRPTPRRACTATLSNSANNWRPPLPQRAAHRPRVQRALMALMELRRLLPPRRRPPRRVPPHRASDRPRSLFGRRGRRRPSCWSKRVGCRSPSVCWWMRNDTRSRSRIER